MSAIHNVRTCFFVLALAACVPAAAAAQDFGVMESAETIDEGNFKLRVNPMFALGKDGQDDEAGLGIMAGYGFTDRFDVEGGVAVYDGFTFFGANAEYWVAKDGEVDFSVLGGLHFGRGDEAFDTRGFDLSFIASKHVSPRLELYGALDFAFESISEDDFDGDGYTPIHLVPGVEYAINDDLDFLAEFGIGLNDEARHYFSAGLAYYFR
jgi:hypothetical protein